MTTIEIPDEQAKQLEPYRDRWGELLLLGLSQFRIQEALLLYERGLISLGRAAELAELSRDEMLRQARAHDIAPRWTPEMIAEELA